MSGEQLSAYYKPKSQIHTTTTRPEANGLLLPLKLFVMVSGIKIKQF